MKSYGKGQIIQTLLCAISILMICSRSQAMGPNTGRWEIHEFMISHWGIPKEEKDLNLFLKDHFNTVIAVPEQFESCQEHGLKALLAAPPEKAVEYVGNPGVWGYFVIDEPSRKGIEFKDLVPRVQSFHRLDPSKPAYINLDHHDDLDTFIKTINPRVLSFDHYQWWAGREMFFPMLEKFRRASLSANIPLICWVEAVCVSWGDIPKDNQAKIRHSVYCSLAYGVKGIQWWAWRNYNRDAGRINTELKHLGPTLVRLKSANVFHTPPVPRTTSPVPRNHWVQSPTKDLVLGIFQDREKHDFILVVNREYRRGQQAVLKFMTGVSVVEKINKSTGKWMALPLRHQGKDQIVKFNIHPGDGELLHVVLQAGFPKNVKGPLAHVDGSEGK
ncbi:MAG: hypothetical protein IIC00_12815 [Planctomycetes bacterium]|nr:hypothetical protein [Planctomycetota bacterium]